MVGYRPGRREGCRRSSLDRLAGTQARNARAADRRSGGPRPHHRDPTWLPPEQLCRRAAHAALRHGRRRAPRHHQSRLSTDPARHRGSTERRGPRRDRRERRAPTPSVSAASSSAARAAGGRPDPGDRRAARHQRRSLPRGECTGRPRQPQRRPRIARPPSSPTSGGHGARRHASAQTRPHANRPSRRTANGFDRRRTAERFQRRHPARR